MPNLSRAWGESSLLPFGCKLVCLQLGQIRGASTAIHHHLLHSHPLRSRPDQIQNPNSKRAVWILEFGVWILDLGFWILDQFSLRSFCGGPKRRRLDFGFWILEFGFWILEFGVWSLEFGFWILEFGFWILDFGLDEALPDIVWILHKIFPCHADSGRRIFRNSKWCPWGRVPIPRLHIVLYLLLACGMHHSTRICAELSKVPQ